MMVIVLMICWLSSDEVINFWISDLDLSEIVTEYLSRFTFYTWIKWNLGWFWSMQFGCGHINLVPVGDWLIKLLFLTQLNSPGFMVSHAMTYLSWLLCDDSFASFYLVYYACNPSPFFFGPSRVVYDSLYSQIFFALRPKTLLLHGFHCAFWFTTHLWFPWLGFRMVFVFFCAKIAAE